MTLKHGLQLVLSKTIRIGDTNIVFSGVIIKHQMKTPDAPYDR